MTFALNIRKSALSLIVLAPVMKKTPNKVRTEYNEGSTEYNEKSTEYNEESTEYNEGSTEYLTIIRRRRGE